MDTNSKLMTLTNRNGRKVRAKVTFHAPIHGERRMVCGMTFDFVEAQDTRVHQSSVCGEWSDVNCPGCKVSPRARYILQNYSLVQLADGTWSARSFYKGALRSEFTGPREQVTFDASRHWGHFNFGDEARAFNRVFFGRMESLS